MQSLAHCLVYGVQYAVSKPWDYKKINYSVIKNRLSKNIISPEWCEAKDLTEDDLLIFSKPEYEIDNELLSSDDCYMYGLILGDGCMNQQSTSCYTVINHV